MIPKKHKTSGLVSCVFWLSVVVTACLCWAAVATNDVAPFEIALYVGAVGLVSYRISAIQEEP